MQDDYDRWNEIKKGIDKRLDSSSSEVFPANGDVWMITLGKNIGFEQNGSGDTFFRAVLIVRKINNHMFLGVPLSTKQKDLNFYFNFTDHDGKKVSAILAQVRLLSVRRLRRKIYTLQAEQFSEIRAKLKEFI